MDSGSEALNVCVCGAAQDRASLLLHTLAEGDVLGHTQCLRLTLYDSADRASDLEEQAIDLNDACYPLLMDVKAETSVLPSLCNSDVVLLLLEMAGLEDMVAVVAKYASALNQSTRTKQKAVIVAGIHATTAAGLLQVLVPQLPHHLVMAVHLSNTVHNYSQYGGSYQLANTVSEHVHAWWMGTQAANTLTTGVSFRGLACTPASCLLPEGMTALPFRHINTDASLDLEHVKQAMEDLDAAIRCLQISEAELVVSLVSSKL